MRSPNTGVSGCAQRPEMSKVIVGHRAGGSTLNRTKSPKVRFATSEQWLVHFVLNYPVDLH